MLFRRLVGSRLVLGLVLATILAGVVFQAGANEPQPSRPVSTSASDYVLGSGDKLRVTTFGEQDLS
ncbi:MAG: hypothetical protein ABL897_00135, partial [Hyphomicrobium sp.]